MKARTTSSWTLIETAHLLNRCAFGGTPDQIRALHALGLEAAVAQLLDGDKAGQTLPDPPAWANSETYGKQVNEFLTMRRAIDGPNKKKSSTGSNPSMVPQKTLEERKELQKKIRQLEIQQGIELTTWWFRQMTNGPYPAREKMTLFWHGHFATSVEKVKSVYFMYLQNSLFRNNALGDYRALTKAIVRDPAMMIYLDLQTSKSSKPNENFAREVMELFTLGEGNYSEDDIKESARAFTGLMLNRLNGSISMNRRQFDNETKKFLGKSGNFGPAEIIDIIFEQPACARFMARKLWRYYVSDAPSEAQVEAFATVFRDANYHIGSTLRTLFLSEEFYHPDNIRAEIKSPVTFLAQLTRQLGIANLPPPLLLSSMREMGQQLFLPPNVAGWPGGSAWINTNTLFARYNIAGALSRGGDPEYTISGLPAKARFGKNKTTNKGARDVRDNMRRDLPKPDYATMVPETTRASVEQVVDQLAFRFLQSPLRAKDRESFIAFLHKESNDKITDLHIARLVHLMLSTPYYQLT